MLYYLLPSLQEYVSWLNVFRYITFRSACGFLLSFFFVLLLLPPFLSWLKAKGIAGQPIREVGPKGHEGKKGTPTMGGAVVVAGVLTSLLLFTDLTSGLVWLIVFVLVGFGAIGLVDDWKKITKQNSLGLSEKQKFIAQIVFAGIAGMFLYLRGFPTDVSLPFAKDIIIPLGGIFFVLFCILVIVGSSNAVNLTDGLDGLAIGSILSIAVTYGVFAYVAGHVRIADYLGVHHVAGAGELAIILASLVGAGLGFLWYNSYPAQVFMGDLGALAIGAVLGLVALIVKHELVLIVAGGILVIEALSVLIQRYYFKLTGKRVFKMAPIHHHFELLGWAEPKIIVRFWIISLVLSLISLSTLKLR